MDFFSWIRFTLLHLFTKLGFHPTRPFYVEYFRKLDLINQSDGKAIIHYRLLQILFLSQAFHYIWLWLYQDHLSHRLNLLHFNIIYLEHLPSYLNLCICLSGVLSTLNLHVLYYRNKGISLQILRQLLLEKRPSFFIQVHYIFKKSSFLSKVSLKRNFNSDAILKNIKLLALAIQTGLQLLLSPVLRKNLITRQLRWKLILSVIITLFLMSCHCIAICNRLIKLFRTLTWY